MAIAAFPIKILAQVGDNEPIEIGSYDVPVSASEPKDSGPDEYQVDLSVGPVDADELARVIDRSLRTIIINRQN